MDRLLYTKPETCKMLGGIGNTKLHEILKTGALDAVYIGKSCRITAESINRYVESLRIGMKPANCETMRHLARGS